MKKKLITLLLCLVMTMGFAATASAAPHSLRFDLKIANGFNAKTTVGGAEKKVAYVGQIVTIETQDPGTYVQSVVLISTNHPACRIIVLGSKFIMPAYDVTVIPNIKNRTCLVSPK